MGLIDANASSPDVAAKLGLHVSKIRIEGQNPTEAILGFSNKQQNDLLVWATHGRDGIEHWLKGSVAETVFHRSAIPTLFVAPTSRGFVSQVSGDISLRRILVPIDHSPDGSNRACAPSRASSGWFQLSPASFACRPVSADAQWRLNA